MAVIHQGAAMPLNPVTATVRPADSGDAGIIAEIHVESWRDAYAGQLPEYFLAGLSVDARRAGWERRLSGRGGVFVVTTADGEIAGFASIGPGRDEDVDEDTGELEAIYLRSGHWGHGYGRLLHERMLDALRAEGHRSATLWVLEGNTRARDFYEAAGWTTDGGTKTDTIGGNITLSEVRYRTSLTAG